MLTSQMHVIPSVGVWNDQNDAIIGNIELGKVVAKVGKTYPGFQHVGSQTSTYNYTTKELTFVILNTVEKVKYLYTVNTTNWSEVNKSHFFEHQQYTGLAYDNTSDAYNLFGTFHTVGKEDINVCKISPNDHQAKIHHTFAGTVCSTFFNSKTKVYYVIYTKPGNLQDLYVSSYDINGKHVEIEQHYEIKNVGSGFKPIPSSFMNVCYDPTKDMIFCNILCESSTIKGPEIFLMSTTQKTFTNFNWNGSRGLLSQFKTTFALFPDLKLPRVYQIALTNDGHTKLYNYSTYNNSWSETKLFSVPVTNIWELK